jgi:hypothetical protein
LRPAAHLVVGGDGAGTRCANLADAGPNGTDFADAPSLPANHPNQRQAGHEAADVGPPRDAADVFGEGEVSNS